MFHSGSPDVDAIRSPEKDHKAQLYALHQLLQKYPEHFEGAKKVELVLIGGSRNAEDAARVESLRALAKELKIEVTSGTAFALNIGHLRSATGTCSIRRKRVVPRHARLAESV